MDAVRKYKLFDRLLQLESNHIGDLMKSGLNIRTISRNKIQSTPKGIVFPYPDCDDFKRTKMDDQTNGKYRSPKGQTNHLYLPRTLEAEVLGNSSVELLITEGEKKTLKAVQEGFPCIGLVGVWGWVKKGKKPIPDLDRIEWNNRKVFIVYDSDAATNEKIQQAEIELATELERRSALVKIVRLPSLDLYEKTGLDDFLIASGSEELQDLIQHAVEPRPARRNFRTDDTGNAERFVHLHGNSLKYVAGIGWHEWNGMRWKSVSDRHVVDLSKAVSSEILQEAAQTKDDDFRDALKKGERFARSKTGRKNLVELASGELETSASEFDTNAFKFNVRNGTIDLKTGKMEPHRRNDFITKIAPVEFDPQADCPLFKKFLNRIFNNNRNLINFVQTAIGYALSGDTLEQCFFILYGTGKNGKSTLVNVIEQLMGDYGKHSRSESFFEKRGMSANNDIARLKGARFVSAIESEDNGKLSESLIKQVTGGDTITARFLYREEFEFKPEFKLFLATNHKPVITGTDEAIWRRIRLIFFNVEIPEDERDKNLGEKLSTELSGILNWALEGFRNWQKNGLQSPLEVDSATNQYRNESDILAEFLNECCETKTESSCLQKEIYGVYEVWCKGNGETPEERRAIRKQLIERGFETDYGTGNKAIFKGLKLKTKVKEPQQTTLSMNRNKGKRW